MGSQYFGKGHHQQDAYGHAAGDSQGMGAVGYEPLRIAPYSLLGGIIDTCAGNQGQQRGNQIGNSGILADSSHNYSENSGNHCGSKVAQQFPTTKSLDDAEYCPG